MKTKDIVALLKDGKKPMVKITGDLWDDSWGCAGMLARIVSFTDASAGDDEMVEMEFDYNENKAHNLAVQPRGYYIYEGGCDTGKTGTIFEAGDMEESNIHESVIFEVEGVNADVPVELADSPILNEYLKSGSKLPYVEWLEIFINCNVPECMKPWVKI